MFRKFLVLALLMMGASLYAASLRMDPLELSKNLSGFKILDARDAAVFAKGHIEGSYNFPSALTFNDPNQNGTITQPDKMQKLLRSLGLSTHDAIVVYDNGAFADAARLFWSLEVYGFTHVKLLNGGFHEWEAKGFKVSTKMLTPKESEYVATVNNKKLSTKFITQIAIKNPNQIIIDGRERKEYIGEKSTASRFGHIAKAIHIPAIDHLTGDNTMPKLKTVAELEKLYQDVAKNTKVIAYCSVGKISGINYFAMRELGYDVSNYDASWNEWGNDPILPIENPSVEK